MSIVFFNQDITQKGILFILYSFAWVIKVTDQIENMGK